MKKVRVRGMRLHFSEADGDPTQAWRPAQNGRMPDGWVCPCVTWERPVQRGKHGKAACVLQAALPVLIECAPPGAAPRSLRFLRGKERFVHVHPGRGYPRHPAAAGILPQIRLPPCFRQAQIGVPIARIPQKRYCVRGGKVQAVARPVRLQ